MAFNLFRKINIAGLRSYVGVDIGTASIKAVQMEGGGEKPKITNYAIFETYEHLERINTALQTSTLKLYDEEVAEYLKLVFKKAKFTSDQIIASLPTFSAFTTLIEIPKMSSSEVNKTIGFKARQYVPMPMTSVTIDWIKVGEKTDELGNELQQIFLISIPNEQIEKYKRIFKLAGLRLTAVEIEGLSLARTLSGGSDKPILIVDIGSRSTTFLIAQNGLLKFLSQSDFAGSSLTQSLASGLGVNIRRAEDIKRQRGLSGLGYGPERELSTLLLPLLDVIINEAKRAQESFENSYRQKVGGVILTGGGANLADLEKYFNQEFELPVSKADPFKTFAHSPEIAALTENLGPSLSVALGLAAKPFFEN